MKKIHVEDLKGTEILGEDIYGSANQLLFRKGIKLRRKYIDSLTRRGVFEVRVYDDADEVLEKHFPDTEYPVDVSEKLKNNTIKFLSKFYSTIEHDIRATNVTKIRDLVSSSSFKDLLRNPQTIKMIDNLSKALVDSILDIQILSGLKTLENYDDYTYGHSLNVAVYSLIIARKIGVYGVTDLINLAKGCLLHDVGKVLVNKSILNKKGKLDQAEYYEIQKHAEYGYMMLKDTEDFHYDIPHIAYQHHEKGDGKGYPRGLRFPKDMSMPGRAAKRQFTSGVIHPFALIASTADVFDALTTDRPYREALPLDASLKILTDEFAETRDEARHLKADCVWALIKSIYPYPLRTKVRIHAPQQFKDFVGVVIKQNEVLNKPVVALYSDAQKKRLEAPVVINTMQDKYKDFILISLA